MRCAPKRFRADGFARCRRAPHRSDSHLPPAATCAIQVEWHAAQAACPPLDALRYNVYRSQDPAFVPGPENLVASVAAPAGSWLDTSVPVYSDAKLELRYENIVGSPVVKTLALNLLDTQETP